MAFFDTLTRKEKRKPDTLEAGPEVGLREALTDLMTKAYGGGAGGRQMGRQSAGLFDWLPGVGEAVSAEDAKQSFGEGDYLGAALAGVGAIPGVGKAAKVVKGAGAAADAAKVASKVPAQPRAAKIGDNGGPPLSDKWDIVPEDPQSVTKKDYGKNPKLLDPEYFHKVGGGIKMEDKPFSQLSWTREHTGGKELPPQKQLQPEDLLGKIGMGLPADKTAAGEILTHVGGTELKNPQPLQGGYRFADENPGSSWANSPVEAQEIVEEARRVSDENQGADILATPIMMGSRAGNSSRMMSDPLLDLTGQMWDDIPAAAKEALDAQMSALLTNKRGVNRWPGLERAVKEPTWRETAKGTERSALADAMTTAKLAPYFPNTGEITAAITDKHMLNRPELTTGMAFNKFDLSGSGINESPLNIHSTYPAQTAGSSEGRLGYLPLDWLMPDFAKSRPAGESSAHTLRSILTQKPTQKFDDEWLENLMRQYEMRARG